MLNTWFKTILSCLLCPCQSDRWCTHRHLLLLLLFDITLPRILQYNSKILRYMQINHNSSSTAVEVLCMWKEGCEFKAREPESQRATYKFSNIKCGFYLSCTGEGQNSGLNIKELVRSVATLYLQNSCNSFLECLECQIYGGPLDHLVQEETTFTLICGNEFASGEILEKGTMWKHIWKTARSVVRLRTLSPRDRW